MTCERAAELAALKLPKFAHRPPVTFEFSTDFISSRTQHQLVVNNQPAQLFYAHPSQAAQRHLQQRTQFIKELVKQELFFIDIAWGTSPFPTAADRIFTSLHRGQDVAALMCHRAPIFRCTEPLTFFEGSMKRSGDHACVFQRCCQQTS